MCKHESRFIHFSWQICPYWCAYLMRYATDLPRWRPLHSQRSNTATPQPVPGELLWGMLQATRESVWGGSGRREWRRRLAWHHPYGHLPNLHPVIVLKHNTGVQLSTIHTSSVLALFVLVRLCCIWTPIVRMLNPKLPDPTPFCSEFKSKKAPPGSQQKLTTWHDVLEYTDLARSSLLQQGGPAP